LTGSTAVNPIPQPVASVVSRVSKEFSEREAEVSHRDDLDEVWVNEK